MESNGQLNINGMKEAMLFLKIGAMGIRDGWFTKARPKVFSKTEIAEHLTNDKRDMTCYNLVKKMVDKEILQDVSRYGDKTTYYSVNPKKYTEELQKLCESHDLFRYAKMIFKDLEL